MAARLSPRPRPAASRDPRCRDSRIERGGTPWLLISGGDVDRALEARGINKLHSETELLDAQRIASAGGELETRVIQHPKRAVHQRAVKDRLDRYAHVTQRGSELAVGKAHIRVARIAESFE